MFDVYRFLDYRALLRAWFDAHPRVSQSRVARKAGLSAALLSRVMSGERRLDPTRVRALCAALKLTEDEQAYLADLVELEDPVLARRREALLRLTAARGLASAATVKDATVFTHWAYGAVWQLARCDGFCPTPEWICAHIQPPISHEQALEALSTLIGLGFLEPDGDTLRPVSAHQVTPKEVPKGTLSEALRRWHGWHLHRAAEALAEVPAAERHVAGFTVAVTPDQVEEIRGKIRDLEHTIAALADRGEGHDRVYQLQIAFVPLSRPTGS